MDTTQLRQESSAGSRNYWLLPAIGCALALAVIVSVPGPSVMQAYSFSWLGGSSKVCLPGYQLQSLVHAAADQSNGAGAHAHEAVCVATRWSGTPA